MEYKVIGKRIKRYDGMSHVTGETRYVDDIYVPGTLVVKALRSPVHKGKLQSIDVSEAEKMPGVAGVITNEDVPNPFQDQPVLAVNIRYRGEPIAAVAAVDEDTALAALAKIKVKIEEEVPVFDPIEAMKPDAPKVRPEGNFYMFGKYPFRKVVLGDVEAGFKEADHIIEGEYFHPMHEQVPMEPWCCLAVPEADGRLTVHTQSQGIHLSLGWLESILHAEPGSPKTAKWSERTRRRGITGYSDLRLIGGFSGGAFGGKMDVQADHLTCILALKTGRPCKWRWTREEENLYSTRRGPWIMKIKDGVKKDGRIVARQIKAIRDAGAYTSFNAYAVDKYSFLATGPYYIPNVYVEAYCIFTNKVYHHAMRGFGITHSALSTEVQMNKIAAALGIDPWEIRFINAYHNGDRSPTRRVLDSVYLIETMQELAKKAGVTLPDKLMKMTSAERGQAQ